jgi:hypothetical protein
VRLQMGKSTLLESGLETIHVTSGKEYVYILSMSCDFE